MAFTPINTQEEFDAAISDRLKRERAKFDGYLSPDEAKEKYKGYLSPDEADKKYKDYLSPDAATEKYKGYLSPDEVKEKYKGYLSPEEAAKKDEQIKGYETSSVKMRIANEMGIPQELADRLSGETEEDIKKDAKLVAGLMKVHKSAPLRNAESGGGGDDKKAAYKKLLEAMKGE